MSPKLEDGRDISKSCWFSRWFPLLNLFGGVLILGGTPTPHIIHFLQATAGPVALVVLTPLDWADVAGLIVLWSRNGKDGRTGIQLLRCGGSPKMWLPPNHPTCIDYFSIETCIAIQEKPMLWVYDYCI